jgi:nucleoid-associated protein YgaU
MGLLDKLLGKKDAEEVKRKEEEAKKAAENARMAAEEAARKRREELAAQQRMIEESKKRAEEETAKRKAALEAEAKAEAEKMRLRGEAMAASMRQAVEEVKPKTYVVKSGDSLSKIAKELLGDAKRWPEIYELNKALIGGNPNLIHPGQELKLPK